VTGQWKQHPAYNNMPQSQSVLQAAWPNLEQQHGKEGGLTLKKAIFRCGMSANPEVLK